MNRLLGRLAMVWLWLALRAEHKRHLKQQQARVQRYSDMGAWPASTPLVREFEFYLTPEEEARLLARFEPTIAEIEESQRRDW